MSLTKHGGFYGIQTQCKMDFGTRNHYSSPIIQKRFHYKKTYKQALCKVSGIGSYILTLDGNRVDDFLLNPRFSNYDEIVYYNSFELDLTKTNLHTIGICLGRGRHSMLTENTWGWHRPFWDKVRKLILELEIFYTDGTVGVITSVDSWFYSHLAGLKTDGPGFGNITLMPYFPAGLDNVNSSFISANGKTAVSWMRTEENKIKISVELPENTKGVFINSLNTGYKRSISSGINEFVI